MRLKLFWKIYLSIALSSVALVWGLSYLSEQVERKMSFIAPADQAQLLAYRLQAKAVLEDNPAQLSEWANWVEQHEQTRLVIVQMEPSWLQGQEHEDYIAQEVSFGRMVDWPIHLSHEENPIIDLPLAVQGYHLLIQLPPRMRPGAHWQLIHLAITILLPLLLVAVLSYFIYRHIIKPLEALHSDTTKFRAGSFDQRVSASASNRHDEIGQLALSFNHMADSISALINSQRQLIADISHELRTPITRLRLTLDSDYQPAQMYQRIEREINCMADLVEDTLTLAWLDNEKPQLNQEDVDLVALLESIIEDASFEFPNHPLAVDLPNECIAHNSNHRALGQSVENIVRNAMKYTPIDAGIEIQCQQHKDHIVIEIKDKGAGVPASKLDDIFKPFVRLDKSRDRNSGGYGLGLALAKRQIKAIGGSLVASHNQPHGLIMTINLPL